MGWEDHLAQARQLGLKNIARGVTASAKYLVAFPFAILMIVLFFYFRMGQPWLWYEWLLVASAFVFLLAYPVTGFVVTTFMMSRTRRHSGGAGTSWPTLALGINTGNACSTLGTLPDPYPSGSSPVIAARLARVDIIRIIRYTVSR